MQALSLEQDPQGISAGQLICSLPLQQLLLVSPCMYHVFPEKRIVWEFMLFYLHCSASPLKPQTLEGCLLSNNAKSTTTIYWISSNIRQKGGVLDFISKMHETWNQYCSWQKDLDTALFARWLIGRGVNFLSIHHGYLHVAVRQALPKTSSSWEAWPDEMDGGKRD